jgi:hypothetical protein
MEQSGRQCCYGCHVLMGEWAVTWPVHAHGPLTLGDCCVPTSLPHSVIAADARCELAWRMEWMMDGWPLPNLMLCRAGSHTMTPQSAVTNRQWQIRGY